MRISVVIPALNEEACIGEILSAVARLHPYEIVLVDGGSTDATAEIARHFCRVIQAPRGRGSQQAAGARAVTGDVIWFLHADSKPDAGAFNAIAGTLADPNVIGGNFSLVFDGAGRAARRLTRVYPCLKLLGLCYGDSGLFVRKTAYEAAGGFHPHPLFEDVDLVRRLRKLGRCVTVNERLTTSSRRFEHRNIVRVFADVDSAATALLGRCEPPSPSPHLCSRSRTEHYNRTPYLMRRALPSSLQGLVVGAAALTIFTLEFRQVLRPRLREPKALHTGRNLAIAGIAGLVMNVIEKPLAMRAARQMKNGGIARTILSVVLLDYGLYLWHVLTHKVQFLWRFHLIHHIDLDMDASTAMRFHFGEMLLSVPWRVAQVWVVGASPLALSIWQTLLLVSILFHHSNVKLPLPAERWLRLLIVTPRLHAIHHRPEQSCLDSNWSSGLACWDFLHRTHCWREDRDDSIGVPGYESPEDVTLAKCVTLPFAKQTSPV